VRRLESPGSDQRHQEERGDATAEPETFDAIIIGAGLTGMHQLYRLRQLGLAVTALEAGAGVGGTWYWNRYPGARLDSESYSYQYAFSQDLLDEWDWSETFVGQPELEAYFNRAADKLDLRKDIQLNSRVRSAVFDEQSSRWVVETVAGKRLQARFLITAVGLLSAPQFPQVPGLEDFSGESYHTGLWPAEEVTFTGKRVAVIGTGASGVQVITEIAKTARHLTVFQRTPNWCIPLRNAPLEPAAMAEIRAQYTTMFRSLRETFSGFLHNDDPQSALEVSAEERQRKYELAWASPGFAKWLGLYHDIATNPQANRTYAEFVEAKIRARTADPLVAEKLIPKDHLFGTKRVPCESGYFEVYNQPNVELISLADDPLERFTERGIRTAAGELSVDMIVFATGFDAFTGALTRIDIRGAGGISLKDKWAEGPRTYLGMQIAGFPNLFTLVAPHNKGSTCNIPRCSEQNVEWVTRFVAYLFEHQIRRVEATLSAEAEWTRHVHEAVAETLLPLTDSYFFGANTPGKARAFLGYVGALPDFAKRCNDVAAAGYDGFRLDPVPANAACGGGAA
jgi:cation diffusion facilitator CzcD-associated flavoprotein CzcO